MKTELKESAVVILFLGGSRKVLFLRRNEGWCLPGGKQEIGEDNLQCAIRETEEETGISIKNEPISYLGKSHSISGRIVHVYVSSTIREEVQLSGEHSEWRWCEWDGIKRLGLAGNTIKFIELYGR